MSRVFSSCSRCAVLAFGWYVAVSRLHLRNSQCLEIFLDCAILFFGGGLVVAQLVGRRKKREENWPHPAILVSGSKDAKIVRRANQDGATLLGYNVHKEPWLWPDTVRDEARRHCGRHRARANPHSSKTSSLRM